MFAVCSLCILTIVILVILVIFHFGFGGGTLDLIVLVPGHCLSFTFFSNFHVDSIIEYISDKALFPIALMLLLLVMEGKGTDTYLHNTLALSRFDQGRYFMKISNFTLKEDLPVVFRFLVLCTIEFGVKLGSFGMRFKVWLFDSLFCSCFGGEVLVRSYDRFLVRFTPLFKAMP